MGVVPGLMDSGRDQFGRMSGITVFPKRPCSSSMQAAEESRRRSRGTMTLPKRIPTTEVTNGWPIVHSSGQNASRSNPAPISHSGISRPSSLSDDRRKPVGLHDTPTVTRQSPCCKCMEPAFRVELRHDSRPGPGASFTSTLLGVHDPDGPADVLHIEGPVSPGDLRVLKSSQIEIEGIEISVKHLMCTHEISHVRHIPH